MEQAMATATLQGLTQVQQLGLAGVFLTFIFIMAGIALWYFANHCEKRSDAALEAYKEEVKENRVVINRNTEAFNGVQITLARLEGKVDK